MNTLEFVYAGTLTIDALGDEIDTGPETYRATYEVRADDSVHVLTIERNDARHGKPALWFADRLDFIAHDRLERLIAKHVARESLRRQWDEPQEVCYGFDRETGIATHGEI